MTSIGSTVWVFDSNRRIYSKSKRGGPIWREHWKPRTVTGETARSWLLGEYAWSVKVPKRGADPLKFAFSQSEIDEQAYVHENRHGIADKVHSLTDPVILRQIAALVGYTT